MQTIRIPYKTLSSDQSTIVEWQRYRASATRTSYANAENRTEKELRDLLKSRFPDHPLGSWDLHCAAREGLRLRRITPNGSMVFGGKPALLRRQKNQINNTEWKVRRQRRAIEIVGDRTLWGNRHFRLSEDARTCEVAFLKQKVTLYLPEMASKRGYLLRAVSKLAAACQISVTFTLSPTHLSVTFDEMDLRRLLPGQTLEQVKMKEQGKGRRGRKRKDPATHYAAHREKHIPSDEWPVHPEWRNAIPTMPKRAIGIDLNPNWIGLSVIQIDGDPQELPQIRVLDHRLHLIEIPIGADQSMTQTMAQIATQTVSLARAWNAGLIVHENGLGKLRWSKKSKADHAMQTINYWSRNTLLNGLARRCRLANIEFMPVWAGYSSTIGNLFFDLPDACGAAAEIARRGLAARAEIKDRLPVVPPRVANRRWKDGELHEAYAKALAEANDWQAIHRIIKSAQAGPQKRSGVGYRRLHPSREQMGSGSFTLQGRSYAVDRLGGAKGASHSARPILSRTDQTSSDRVWMPDNVSRSNPNSRNAVGP